MKKINTKYSSQNILGGGILFKTKPSYNNFAAANN